MTRKDYVLAAKIVAETYNASGLVKEIKGLTKVQERELMLLVAEEVEEAFVDFFRRSGGNFDQERFRAACKG